MPVLPSREFPPRYDALRAPRLNWIADRVLVKRLQDRYVTGQTSVRIVGGLILREIPPSGQSRESVVPAIIVATFVLRLFRFQRIVPGSAVARSRQVFLLLKAAAGSVELAAKYDIRRVHQVKRQRSGVIESVVGVVVSRADVDVAGAGSAQGRRSDTSRSFTVEYVFAGLVKRSRGGPRSSGRQSIVSSLWIIAPERVRLWLRVAGRLVDGAVRSTSDIVFGQRRRFVLSHAESIRSVDPRTILSNRAGDGASFHGTDNRRSVVVRRRHVIFGLELVGPLRARWIPFEMNRSVLTVTLWSRFSLDVSSDLGR